MDKIVVSITDNFIPRINKMASTVRATAWSLTINNPSPADEENISLARQKGWRVHGQLEKGKEGTPHYQLALFTPQVRFSTVKKHFPRAHIEVARDRNALEKYVNKEDTRIGELKENQELYPSLQKLWDMFADYISSLRGLHNDWTQDGWLTHFDKFIRLKIEEGYVVETMAVNPQIRSCVKHFGENIYNRSLRRQTDRQTEVDAEVDNILSVEEYKDGEEADDEESSEGSTEKEGNVEETVSSGESDVHRDYNSRGP